MQKNNRHGTNLTNTTNTINMVLKSSFNGLGNALRQKVAFGYIRNFVSSQNLSQYFSQDIKLLTSKFCLKGDYILVTLNFIYLGAKKKS